MTKAVLLSEHDVLPEEKAELERLEHVIEMAKRAPEAEAVALDEIRRRRLYRARGYQTFELYVTRHLQISRRAALFACSAATIRGLLPDVNHGSHSARALRPLFPLVDLRDDAPTRETKERVAEAFTLAERAALSEGRDEPNARDLKAAVDVVLGRTTEAAPFTVTRAIGDINKVVDQAERAAWTHDDWREFVHRLSDLTWHVAVSRQVSEEWRSPNETSLDFHGAQFP